MAKDTFYFTHDYNSRTDEKIKLLIRRHGMTGYGIFWSIIEDLYNNANALRTDYEGIAFDLHSNESIVKSVINDFELFSVNGEYFGSLSIERRLNERSLKSEKARESASYRWSKDKTDANALPKESERNAIKERKGKKIKKEEVDTQTPFGVYNNWLKSTYPSVASLKTQMTSEQFDFIINTFGKDKFVNILMQMENKADLTKKYKSVYLTSYNWLKNAK